uniref:Amino acid adenylation domain-containing protein n=1 Tax=Candidatus Kentrum sp. TUN TaxID=2126343 RepID=A0A450ZN74_9GAMM|nr:MAG: amino acid adenylation domain-containing protein [Candidatus Kentron sp. TUN]VFK55221.1 MAG: amino acid adenylation domain-containing protein [Candidatus Kentron sp. TUN]
MIRNKSDYVRRLLNRVAAYRGISEDALDLQEPLMRKGLGRQQIIHIVSDVLKGALRPETKEALSGCVTLADISALLEERGSDLVLALADNDPIAIVGMACRFPAGPNPSAFWDMLISGRDARGPVPPGRWDIDAFYDPDPDTPGTVHTRYGYFLDRVDGFEPEFFRISPREAMDMDPQQRIMLELSWEALEDAGLALETLRGSRTSVHFSVLWNDYATLHNRVGFQRISSYSATGSDYAIIANRVSYALGLRGPSMAIGTACSGALVAIHLACVGLRSGQATLALAGGVNLNFAPDSHLMMAKFGGLAPDGRCKTFSAHADGYGRGEGGGVVVLKRLSAALADEDRVYCVIRGGAVNNDGYSEGMAAPSIPSQQTLIEDACLDAGLDPATVAYVEAHGTGTPLGDRVETQALGAILGRAEGRKVPVRIGSVKTNIGHLEAAAGVAGLIKTALALHHGHLPASLHAEPANPEIDFHGLGLRVQAGPESWPRSETPRIAGVNSFGFGGTNCHVVLSEAPEVPTQARGDETENQAPLLLSAHTEAGLHTRARRLRAWLLENPQIPLTDVAWTCAVRRWHHAHRLAVVTDAATGVEPREQLLSALDAAARGVYEYGSMTGNERRSRLAFIFSGHGANWLGMGRDLFAEDVGFRQGFEQAAAAVAAVSDLDLQAELRAGEETEHSLQMRVAQPLLFAVQIALASAWRHRGIVPDVIIGHSVGEIAAACVAGALSIADGARVTCSRSELGGKHGHGKGGMLVVGLDPKALTPRIASYSGAIEFAGFNDPHTTVISGDLDPLLEFKDKLDADEVFCRLVRIKFASHSHHVDSLKEPLRASLDGILPCPIQPGGPELISTVTLKSVQGPELTADYWVDNMRRPVQLAGAVQRAIEGGVGRFVEISPHALLSVSIEQTAASLGETPLILPSLLREQAGFAVMRRTLVALHVDGQPVDWTRHFPHPGRVISLPNYPWQHRRFWPEDLELAARGGVAGATAFPSAPAIYAEKGAAPPEETPSASTQSPAEFITAQVARLLMIEPRKIPPDRSLRDLGMDSLMAQRLRNAIERRYDVTINVVRIMREGTVDLLVEQVGADGTAPTSVPIPARPDTEKPEHPMEYPASHGQRALWFVHRLAPESAAYNIIFAGIAREAVDTTSMEYALARLAHRQSSLRVTFHAGEDSPIQRISPYIHLPFQVIDGGGWDEARLDGKVSEVAHRPFDLEQGPLFRVLLIRNASPGDVLLFVVHHIVADGTSLDILMEELQEYYKAERTGQSGAPDDEPVFEYPAFVEHERELLGGIRGQVMSHYWREALAGPLTRLAIPRTARPGDPVDRAPVPPRPAIQTFAGEEVIAKFAPKVSARVRTFAEEHGLTLYMVYLAAFSALLHRYTGERDILVGSYTSLRDRAELERAVGYYLNTVVLRADFSDHPNFAALIERTRNRVYAALEHSALPFSFVVEKLNPERNPSRSPLTDVVFNWISPSELGVLSSFFLGAEDGEAAVTPGVLGLRPYPLRRNFARFDLEIAMGETHGETTVYLQYNTAVLDRTTVTTLAHHFEQLIVSLLDAPDREIRLLSLLAPEEERTILRLWNDTASGYERHLCLHERIAAQIRRTPDRVAARALDRALMTYREFGEQTTRIATALNRLGVGPGSLVGVCTDRSSHLLCALVGVLTAGGAYVPLDPDYPPDRLELMIEDSGVGIVLTTASVAGVLPGDGRARVLVLDDDANWPGKSDNTPAVKETTPVTAADPAYVIYTSGSTGRPKGVVITHGNIGALFHWADHAFEPDELTGTLASTSMCFDISVFELFYPLTMGGTVLMADNALVMEDLPWAEEITLLNTVPSVMGAVLDLPRFPRSIRTVTLVGEPLRRDLVQQIYAHPGVSRVVNLYGPTEDTVFSTQSDVPREDPFEPTIGHPMQNTRCYVLDEALQPVPVLHVGELYLAGEGIARGYHGRPELTAERFVPNPFIDAPPDAERARMYKTGDLARYLPNGELECFGRVDTQVKVHGYRIELGEIEATLTQLREIRQAVVIVREVHGDRRLIGYYIPNLQNDDPLATEERIRLDLVHRLPTYMVPSVLMAVDSFPMTPNGKVDRNRLPEPNMRIEHSGRSADAGKHGTGMLTPAQRKVARTWSEALDVEPDEIGPSSEFYELGGHSLLLTTVAPKLEALFGKKVAVADLFRFRTLESLAGWLEAKAACANEPAEATTRARGRARHSRQVLLDRRRARERDNH